MSLRKKQSDFVLAVSKLIVFAYDNGYELTFGEVYRTKDQQMLYYEGATIDIIDNEIGLERIKPKSYTMKSKHLDRLAVDFNLFKDGKYLSKTSDHELLGKYWESIGGLWGGRFKDGNHYEWQ